MTQTETLEVSRKEVPTTKIKVKNTSTKGRRVVFDHTLKQHLLGPGEEAEIEVSEAEAKRMQEASTAGTSDVTVDGHDPEEKKAVRLADAPEQPEEHKHRPDLAAAERDEMEAGAEADKERREKVAKMTGPELAAETGIHMHARGLKPDVVVSPPDAPPKKK